MGTRDVLCVATALLAVAGCGGSDSSGAVPDGPGPVSELLGFEMEEPAELRRKELAMEEAVAECMRAEGWEYTPVDYSAQFPDVAEEDVSLFDDPEAYGEKYGYGVAHNYETWEAASIEAGEGGMMGAGQEIEDPNWEYQESLSPAEREEYGATLWGELPELGRTDSPDDLDALPLEEQGCHGLAQLEVWGEDPMQSNPELQQRMDDHWEGVTDDPRMVAAREEWLECMGEVVDGLDVDGESVDGPDDMYMHFDERKMEAMGLHREPFDDSDPEAWNEDVYTVMSDASGEDSWAWIGRPEPISDADLEELRAAELEMWKLDWECQKDADFPMIQRRIEEEFADELRADFPELADEASEP